MLQRSWSQRERRRPGGASGQKGIGVPESFDSIDISFIIRHSQSLASLETIPEGCWQEGWLANASCAMLWGIKG